MKFAIHEDNIDRLESKITRIGNKCKKYGCEFSYSRIGEEFRVLDEGTSSERIAKYILVEASGLSKVNGWIFAATLEHHDEGNVIRKVADVPEIPERYYNCQAVCEHCKSNRPRKDTYIVYNEETGEFMQVGSSCLCDFTGGLSAEAAAGYISMFDDMIVGEAPSGPSSKFWFSVDELLRYAWSYARDLGYVPSHGDGISTSSEVMMAYYFDRGRGLEGEKERVRDYRDRFHPDYKSDEATQYIENLHKYIDSMDADNSYTQTIKILNNEEYIEGQNIGFVVSMVSCYNRHIDSEKRKAAREEANRRESEVSSYIGSVGARVEIQDPEVTTITSWDTMYGMTIRYKIVDKSGNVCMWDSSSFIDSNQKVKTIRGTVKKFDEYKGVKQTWLTRCRVEYYPKPKKEEEVHAEWNSEAYDAFDDFMKYVEGGEIA